MHKISLCLVVSLLFVFTNAQNRFGGRELPAICEIRGTVVDSTTGFPIEYASISILDKNEDLITGGVTDSDGYFKVREIKPGRYNVIVEFMGFESYKVKDLKLTLRENKSIDLGQIRLISTFILIDEVNVIDEKPIFEFEADKMIYNSADDIVAGSGTAEDVLTKVPMVTVDQDGEVSLRGNPNVKILVNGRPNRLGNDVDYIPASVIEKIEVITSPSAKYDPEGMAGIINIVLTKGRFEGLNGSLKINGKQNKFSSFNEMNGIAINGNYQSEKYNLYSSYSLNNGVRIQNGFRRVYTINSTNDEKEYKYDYDFFNNGERFGQSFKIGTDYKISDSLNMNLEATYSNRYKNKSISQNYLWDGDIQYLPALIKESKEGEDKGNFDTELFIEFLKTHQDPDKESLISFSNSYDKEFEFEIAENNDRTDSDQISSYSEIDFSHKLPINKKSKFEIGYDGRLKLNEEDMSFELSGIDENLNPWRYSGLIDFNFKRNIHSAYLEYQAELNQKISIKPSLRLEYVDKEITFIKSDISTDGTPDSPYPQLLSNTPDSVESVKELNFFPNFSMTYNLENKKSIQLGISKRIKRPGGGWGNQLRPFPRSVYNESFIMIGNANLKPEFSTQYDLSYRSPMPMGFYSANLYYRHVKNPIEWYIDDTNQNISENGTIVSFRNADGLKDYGVEFFFMIMGQTIGGGYNVNDLKDASGDYQLNGKNEDLNVYMRINLPEKYIKVFSYEFGFYYMKKKMPGGTMFGGKGTIWANTGISKSLFDNRVDLSLSVNNIFDMGGFQMDYLEPTLDENISRKTEVEFNRGGRSLSLSVKYNFGEMQKEKRKSRRSKRGGGESMDMGY